MCLKYSTVFFGDDWSLELDLSVGKRAAIASSPPIEVGFCQERLRYVATRDGSISQVSARTDGRRNRSSRKIVERMACNGRLDGRFLAPAVIFIQSPIRG